MKPGHRYHYFLALVGVLLFATAGRAEPLGEVQLISGGACRFPDAAYNSVDAGYLVAWADYTRGARGIFGRRLDSDGRTVGELFRISPIAQTEAFFPAVAYNATDNEYLVTFDTSTTIHGQRIRGLDGTLVGEPFSIGTTQGIRSAVAWSSKSNRYLVAWYLPGRGAAEVSVRLVGGRGELIGEERNLSRDPPYSGYPAVAYATVGDQFLVTWDHEPIENRGRIRGQRLAAATGWELGEAFDITTGGTENRSAIAYDSVRERWLVQYNASPTPGFSYDQFGRFVGSDGKLGEEVPLAHTKAFEGDTLFGGDVAFVPGFGGRFSSSFARDGDATGMAGQESRGDGSPVGGQIDLGTGPYTCLNNAADTKRNRVLTVWEGLRGKEHFIYGRLFQCQEAPPKTTR